MSVDLLKISKRLKPSPGKAKGGTLLLQGRPEIIVIILDLMACGQLFQNMGKRSMCRKDQGISKGEEKME